jgi:hypothetical protein
MYPLKFVKQLQHTLAFFVKHQTLEKRSANRAGIVNLHSTNTIGHAHHKTRTVSFVLQNCPVHMEISRGSFPTNDWGFWWSLLRLVGRSVRRARDGVILKSTTNKGGLL